MTRERDDLLEEMKRKTNERQEEVDELMWQIGALNLEKIQIADEREAQRHEKLKYQERATTLAHQSYVDNRELSRRIQVEQDAKFHLQSANVDLQTRITNLTDLTERLRDQLIETSRINVEQNSVIQKQTQLLQDSLLREQDLISRQRNSWEAWIKHGVDTVVSLPGRAADSVAGLARQGIDAVFQDAAVGGKGYTEEDNKYYKKYLKYKKKYLEVK